MSVFFVTMCPVHHLSDERRRHPLAMPNTATGQDSDERENNFFVLCRKRRDSGKPP